MIYLIAQSLFGLQGCH